MPSVEQASQPPDPGELLTVAEAAAMLKLDEQVIRNWINEGDLAAIRIGKRRVRVRREDLNGLLD
ncbi:MAG: helix-turn-helix domain-containing protein [Acidimicrobiales bacterium]